MQIITIALYDTEKASAPHVFAGKSVEDVLDEVKGFLVHDMVIGETCDQTALDAFNQIQSIDALQSWLATHFCLFAAVRAVHSFR